MLEDHVTGIERDLAALLRVEVSPEFAAGVRARIADPAPSRTWRMWALAAAVMLAIGGGSLLLRTAPGRTAVSPGPTTVAASGGVVGVQRDRSATPRADDSRPAVRARAARRLAEPEIVIDPAIGRAVERLLRSAPPVPAEIDTAAAGATADVLPADMTVALVTVDELTVPLIKIGEPESGTRR